VSTDKNLAVKVAQNLSYEDFVCEVLQLYIVEEKEKLLIVAVQERKHEVALEVR